MSTEWKCLPDISILSTRTCFSYFATTCCTYHTARSHFSTFVKLLFATECHAAFSAQLVFSMSERNFGVVNNLIEWRSFKRWRWRRGWRQKIQRCHLSITFWRCFEKRKICVSSEWEWKNSTSSSRAIQWFRKHHQIEMQREYEMGSHHHKSKLWEWRLVPLWERKLLHRAGQCWLTTK